MKRRVGSTIAFALAAVWLLSVGPNLGQSSESAEKDKLRRMPEEVVK